MTPHDEITRGNEARRLMESPLIAESFARIETEILDAWKTSPARDADGREKLYLMHSMLDRVRSHLQSVAETGMLAARTLQEQSDRAAGLSTLLPRERRSA